MDPSKINFTEKFTNMFIKKKKKKKKKQTTKAGAVDHNVQPSVRNRKKMLEDAGKY